MSVPTSLQAVTAYIRCTRYFWGRRPQLLASYSTVITSPFYSQSLMLFHNRCHLPPTSASKNGKCMRKPMCHGNTGTPQALSTTALLALNPKRKHTTDGTLEDLFTSIMERIEKTLDQADPGEFSMEVRKFRAVQHSLPQCHRIWTQKHRLTTEPSERAKLWEKEVALNVRAFLRADRCIAPSRPMFTNQERQALSREVEIWRSRNKQGNLSPLGFIWASLSLVLGIVCMVFLGKRLFAQIVEAVGYFSDSSARIESQWDDE
ncbi:MAG: hypothetical protein LQ343_002012 [Gyalolechia ehrenbergii]|nr:MAG: hypothetical protein LQ343_002012 [Gyalolechia ehrenbergii]